MFGGGGGRRKGLPGTEWGEMLDGRLQRVWCHRSRIHDKRSFGILGACWTLSAKVEKGLPGYKGVLQAAERFMVKYKSKEEKARLPAEKRDGNRAGQKTDHRAVGGGDTGHEASKNPAIGRDCS